jgi:hypothetical protein
VPIWTRGAEGKPLLRRTTTIVKTKVWIGSEKHI